MGFKDFAVGEVLTSSDVDNFLMRQTVMVFDDSSARDTALAAVLVEGMFAFLKDADTLTFYDGTAWQAFSQGGGAGGFENTFLLMGA